MKSNQQTNQQIEYLLRKVISRYPKDSEPVMTDIHILANPENGSLMAYDDDDQELARCIVEAWAQSPMEDFYDDAASAIRAVIKRLRPEIQQMGVLQPFSFVLTDDDHETLQDLELIDVEETVVLDCNLLEGLEEDLDNFLKELLAED